MQEAIVKHIPIFGFLLGVKHHLPDGTLVDKYSGVVDSIYLGLFPKDLDNYVLKTKFHWNEFDSHMEQNLFQIWKTIKALVIKRALGLHRICATISKSILLQWRKSYRVTCSPLVISGSDSPSKPSKPSNPTRNRISCNTDHTSPSGDPFSSIHLLKTCRGVVCLNEDNFWLNAHFNSSIKIQSSSKQCQRCYKLSNTLKNIFVLEKYCFHRSRIPRHITLTTVCFSIELKKYFILSVSRTSIHGRDCPTHYYIT